ncbi:MAG: response regulator [Melioribacteraceae bacterium]|nr:response regulator [Melioribacteraceae bacterium]
MKRALIIDDDDQLRLLLKRLLERYYDFEVFEATNGEKGLEIYFSIKPHIIFLDLNMPKVSGLQFLEKVNPINSNVSIVVLSNTDDKECIQKILNFGIDDYILKTKFITMLRERLEFSIKKIRSATKILA